MDELGPIAATYDVQLRVESGDATRTLLLLGTDLGQVAAEIRCRIGQMEKDVLDRKRAEAVYKQVKWQYQLEDGSFKEYDVMTNMRINDAYEEGKQNVTWTMSDGTVVEVSPRNKQQVTRSPGGHVTYVAILREDILSGTPPEWGTIVVNKNISKIPLPTTDTKYIEISARFLADTAGLYKINQIIRIQNYHLNRQYKEKKNELRKRNGPDVVNEMELWHGTSGQFVEGINQNGFNRRYSGRTGVEYGEGTYYAKSSFYSSSYCTADPKTKLRYMYLAKVLTGVYTKAQRDTRIVAPPPRDPANPHILYDSVVDDDVNPQLYVVFNDIQAYPAYLVIFQNK